MVEELCELGRQGKLKAPPSTHYALKDYKTALGLAMEPFIGKKQMFVFREMWGSKLKEFIFIFCYCSETDFVSMHIKVGL